MNDELDILTLGFAEAWSMYKVVNNGGETYRRTRFGINIKFDINDYLKGRIIIKPKTGKVLIRGITHKLEEFETELEKREKECKEWLTENYTEEELVSPRGK